jgi:hypothetical protein
MARRWIVVTLGLVAFAACGGAEDPASAPASSTVKPTQVPPATSIDPVETSVVPAMTAGPTAPEPSTFPGCDAVPAVEAPAEWYRDEPVYVGNEQPVDEVRAWARARSGYEDIWLDRDHFGWITVAFSENATVRQAELEVEFPDVGVVAVEVPTTSAELTALQERAHQLLVAAGVEFAGSATYADRWVVGLDVNVADERVAAALAPVASERICLSDAGVPVPEGPQPDEGEGWRLLGDELVGETYRTGIATTDEQYTELWRHVGMKAQRPTVDFETEVVVWFGAVYGSSCPIRLDDIAVDTDRDPAVIHAVTVVPGGTGVCTADANPRAYVVAIERDRVPAVPFAIQLGADDPPVGAPEERTLVDADLSAPGAIATDEQIGPDRTLIEVSQQPQPVETGGIIEPGFPSPYRVDARCGIAVLGQLNGIWWINGTDSVPVPPEWANLIDPNTQTIVVEVLATPGPDPTLTATANGHSVTYDPVAPDTVPACN